MGPPLAGRPPFATDEPDSVYETPISQRGYRQPKPPNPSDRTSAYDMYDSYLNGNENDTESSAGHGSFARTDTGTFQETQASKQPTLQHLEIPSASKNALLAAAGILTPPASPKIAAPRPGYIASVVTLDMEQPERAASSSSSYRDNAVDNASEQQHLQPQTSRTQNTVEPLHRDTSQPSNSSRRAPHPSPLAPHTPSRTYTPSAKQQSYPRHPNEHHPNYHPSQNVPSPQIRAFGTSTPLPTTPHPLQPSLTPIEPVFCREMKGTMFPDEEKQPIMRSTKDLPLPGQRDDKFWRRFSTNPNQQPTRSSWLSRNERRSARFGRCVWIMGLIVVLAIAGGIGYAIWKNSTKPVNSNEVPHVVGDSSNNKARPSSADTWTKASSTPASPTNNVVSPTLTIVDRGLPQPTLGVDHPHHGQPLSGAD